MNFDPGMKTVSKLRVAGICLGLLVWIFPIVYALWIRPSNPKLSTDGLTTIATFSCCIFLLAAVRYRWHDVPFGQRKVGFGMDAGLRYFTAIIIFRMIPGLTGGLVWWGLVACMGLLGAHWFLVVRLPRKEVT
jgi:hypothetical protein